MSTKFLSFPVKRVGNKEWLDLTPHGLAHEFVGESIHQRKDPSFAGGHRVRQYYFKKNVHWLICSGVELNIEAVKPATQAPPRRQARGAR